MPEKPIRILLVEDRPDDALLIEKKLHRDGLRTQCERVNTGDAMKAALARQAWDVVLSDFSMPRFSGLAAFDLLRSMAPDIPLIFVSGTVGEEVAVKAMKLGAADYFVKGHLQRLTPAIERAVRERRDREQRAQVERELRGALVAKEEQLRQSQKMEAVGRLAGGVAHDFNNMLSVILGFSELAAAGLAPDDERLAHLREVRGAGKRAAELTRQLLLFSRHEDPEQEVLELNALLRGTEKLCRRLLGEDVEFVCLLSDTSARVRANRGHLEQVVVNLVVNARDALTRGGRLTISTSNVVLASASVIGALTIAPGPYVLVKVSDTGIGMNREIQARIFEPFFTTKERGKGTGLGLSTVFGIVQQSRGAIEVESEPGRGSTFSLYLPRVEEAARGSTSLRPAPSTLKGSETILLVEDDDGVRKVARTILRRNGYVVLEASAPEAAFSLCESHPEIRLVLSDVVMPNMAGPEVWRRIRSSHPNTAVLFMSGYTDESRARYPLGSGDAFLQKPFTPESLTRKVREVLDATSG